MQVKVIVLVAVSIVIAVLLASALNSFNRVSDSALAQVSPFPSGEGRGEVSSRPSTAGKNYLPIIFLNSATAGGAWLLAGNAGTNWNSDFLGTTDNMTLTFRVSNTIAYRIVPAADLGNRFSPNIIGGSSANSVAPGIVGATIAGGGVISSENVITGKGNYAFIGGGLVNTASGSGSAIGGGQLNNASGSSSVIGGGSSNSASNFYATIGGGRFITASGAYATIGGGWTNLASGNFSFIGGGAGNTASNSYATVGGGTFITASGMYATVGGGWDNLASANASFIGGGEFNKVSGAVGALTGGSFNTVSGTNAFVGGGDGNTAGGTMSSIGGGNGNKAYEFAAAVGGGSFNTASGIAASVGGGSHNTASGTAATVVGGEFNTASGIDSFAAGDRAQAVHRGAFVWADSLNLPLASTADDQFLVRASGGITLYTNSAATVGASLYGGSGSWNTLSNKNLKANFADVESRAILAQVNALPITTWNYTTQDESIRHIGPMAQDFAAAFNVGENDTTISTVDAQGVALAAIQGLAQENKELKARVSALEANQSQNLFAVNNLPVWGIVALLAVMVMRKRK